MDDGNAHAMSIVKPLSKTVIFDYLSKDSTMQRYILVSDCFVQIIMEIIILVPRRQHFSTCPPTMNLFCAPDAAPDSLGSGSFYSFDQSSR